MIWSCSETIEEQSKNIIGTEKEKEKIQNELWKLVNWIYQEVLENVSGTRPTLTE